MTIGRQRDCAADRQFARACLTADHARKRARPDLRAARCHQFRSWRDLHARRLSWPHGRARRRILAGVSRGAHPARFSRHRGGISRAASPAESIAHRGRAGHPWPRHNPRTDHHLLLWRRCAQRRCAASPVRSGHGHEPVLSRLSDLPHRHGPGVVRASCLVAQIHVLGTIFPRGKPGSVRCAHDGPQCRSAQPAGDQSQCRIRRHSRRAGWSLSVDCPRNGRHDDRKLPHYRGDRRHREHWRRDRRGTAVRPRAGRGIGVLAEHRRARPLHLADGRAVDCPPRHRTRQGAQLNDRTTTAESPRAASIGAFGGQSSRMPLTIVAVAIVFVVGAVAPTRFAGDFVLRLANEGLLLGMLALSVAFLMSQAGLVALGAASVYGGAGLLFAIAMSQWDLTPINAVCASFLIILLYATVLGPLHLRTNPLAFMMLTLAAGEMISHGVMLEGLRDYTGGADGLVVNFRGALFGLTAADYANAAQFWPIAWSAAWIVGLAAFAARRSRFGAILRAVRGNEKRMRFSGFDTYLPRLIAYVLVNVVAAVSGLLHVLNAGFVS